MLQKLQTPAYSFEEVSASFEITILPRKSATGSYFAIFSDQFVIPWMTSCKE
ncbi:MAG: hypothetical protein WCH59_08470 [Chitinophagia bacterium]